jgi:hypothetical protein
LAQTSALEQLVDTNGIRYRHDVRQT